MSAATVPTPARPPCPLEQSLPLELQQDIIRQLDPVGLVSLSQCSRHFRGVIAPGKREWAEWLLVVECQARNGGGTPIHEVALDGTFRVNWTPSLWEDLRWACTSCLRLLPHIAFDNRSLLQSAYRKPPSAGASFTTSWVPTLHGTDRGSAARTGRRRRRGDQAVSSDNRTSFPGEQPRLCGYGRLNRRCNECRYQAGALRPQLSHWGGYMGGTRKVPILRSRRVSYESPLDRWFPRLADFLEAKPPDFPPRVMRAIRWNAPDEEWTTYMVRCPHCEMWQELRAFRFGGTYVNWKPSHDGQGGLEITTTLNGQVRSVHLDHLCCNACYARQHGQEALAGALLSWFRTPFSLHRWHIECRLRMPECRLTFDGFRFPGFAHEVRKLTRGLRELKAPIDDFETYSYADVAECLLFYTSFVTLWREMKAANPELTAELEDDDSFFLWLQNFHETEAHWRWIAACQVEVEDNPDVLVRWALERAADS